MLTAARFDANCDTGWIPQLAVRGSCSHHMWPLAATCGQGPSFFFFFSHAQDDKVPGVLMCALLSSFGVMFLQWQRSSSLSLTLKQCSKVPLVLCR